MVEQRTENPCVPGSIPGETTKPPKWRFFYYHLFDMTILLFFLGVLLGSVFCFFLTKAKFIEKTKYDELNNQFIKQETLLETQKEKLKEFEELKNSIQEKDFLFDSLKNELVKSNTDADHLENHIKELKTNQLNLEDKIEHLSHSNQNYLAELSELRAINNSLKDSLEKQKEEFERLRNESKIEFENLASKILEEKTEKFTQLNQSNIKTILEPLQEKITSFQEKVESTHKENIHYNASLREQINGLKDLNLQMSKEAINLTKALKGDNKIQGNWGELILEKVLEKSGLEKGREYEIQKSHTLQDGRRLQPDVIIHLPDQKKMIIDSKVSLTSYERFINEEEETERILHLKNHISSLKNHIKSLSEKNYLDLYQESPDFVLLFIPIEPAFAFALKEEPEIFNKAFEKNIIIVTPTTLLATLRTIDSMWTNEKHQKNSLEIARQAGALYDKFCGFVDNLIKVGNKMNDAKKEYDQAMGKLSQGRGNLVVSSEKLKKMGAKVSKSLPENLLYRANESNNQIKQE